MGFEGMLPKLPAQCLFPRVRIWSVFYTNFTTQSIGIENHNIFIRSVIIFFKSAIHPVHKLPSPGDVMEPSRGEGGTDQSINHDLSCIRVPSVMCYA